MDDHFTDSWDAAEAAVIKTQKAMDRLRDEKNQLEEMYRGQLSNRVLLNDRIKALEATNIFLAKRNDEMDAKVKALRQDMVAMEQEFNEELNKQQAEHQAKLLLALDMDKDLTIRRPR